jgi:hypothetical protein
VNWPAATLIFKLIDGTSTVVQLKSAIALRESRMEEFPLIGVFHDLSPLAGWAN